MLYKHNNITHNQQVGIATALFWWDLTPRRTWCPRLAGLLEAAVHVPPPGAIASATHRPRCNYHGGVGRFEHPSPWKVLQFVIRGLREVRLCAPPGKAHLQTYGWCKRPSSRHLVRRPPKGPKKRTMPWGVQEPSHMLWAALSSPLLQRGSCARFSGSVRTLARAKPLYREPNFPSRGYPLTTAAAYPRWSSHESVLRATSPN